MDAWSCFCHPSVKLHVLSEASGTSRWLEITRDQCLVEPTLGPMDIVRLLVSASTHVYQLQVLYPVTCVVDTDFLQHLAMNQ